MEIYLSQKNIRINRKILCDLLKHVTTAKHKRVQNAAFSSYAPRAHRVAGREKAREKQRVYCSTNRVFNGMIPSACSCARFSCKQRRVMVDVIRATSVLGWSGRESSLYSSNSREIYASCCGSDRRTRRYCLPAKTGCRWCRRLWHSQ